MEFICALSVNGSLVSYRVKSAGINSYEATLRSGYSSQLPAQIEIKKTSEGWITSAEHPEITASLCKAIEINL